MRVRLVGSQDQRNRLRRVLASAGIEVAGEFDVGGQVQPPDNSEVTVVVDSGDAGHARQPRPLVEPLTPRELAVLQVLAEGLSNKAIAERLRISDQTVKFHVAAICGKLSAMNRTDAVRIAIQRGLVAI